MIQHACFEISRNLIKTAAAAFCMAFAWLNIDVAAVASELAGAADASPVGGGSRLAAYVPANGQDARSPGAANAAKWSRLRAAAGVKGGARLQAAKPTADLRCDKLVQDGTNTFFKAVIE